jgi:hypothetical protein
VTETKKVGQGEWKLTLRLVRGMGQMAAEEMAVTDIDRGNGSDRY